MRGTSLGVGLQLGALEQEVADETCPYFRCTELSSLGTTPFNFQSQATQAQTCPDLEQGQGWVCLRLL